MFILIADFLARQVDKYRAETCCVIGNYFSLRSFHEKAVTYFQRALKLNPNYLSAWTLMGHEFIELKNTNAAIQCYRRAIEVFIIVQKRTAYRYLGRTHIFLQVNKRDYRAWYGLGQTYEMLKMPFYCLYYYKKAQELRPNDSRMLVALGESYEKLDQMKVQLINKYSTVQGNKECEIVQKFVSSQNAMKCFWKAHCVGDVEGNALFQLAKLFERGGDCDQAAAAYHQYITDSEMQGVDNDRDQQSLAYRFLAQYFVRKGQLEDAYDYGQRCANYSSTCEEGKAILKEIANRRAQQQQQHEASLMLHRQQQRQQQQQQQQDETLGMEGGGDASAVDASGQPLRGVRGDHLEPMNLTFTP